MDDSPSPSPFFSSLSDPTVRYKHVEEPTALGAKRNALASVAAGTVLAHFDDDDYYSPAYLETMVSADPRPSSAPSHSRRHVSPHAILSAIRHRRHLPSNFSKTQALKPEYPS